MSTGVEFDPEERKAIAAEVNLSVLKRLDPSTNSVICSASHVALYKLVDELPQWRRCDIEGSLFIVERNSPSTSTADRSRPHDRNHKSDRDCDREYDESTATAAAAIDTENKNGDYRIVIINGKSPNNYLDDVLTGNHDIEHQRQMIMFSNSKHVTIGILFYQPDEATAIFSLIDKIVHGHRVKPPQKPQPSPRFSKHTGKHPSATKQPTTQHPTQHLTEHLTEHPNRHLTQKPTPQPTLQQPQMHPQQPPNFQTLSQHQKQQPHKEAQKKLLTDRQQSQPQKTSNPENPLQRFFPDLKRTDGVIGQALPDPARDSAVFESDVISAILPKQYHEQRVSSSPNPTAAPVGKVETFASPVAANGASLLDDSSAKVVYEAQRTADSMKRQPVHAIHAFQMAGVEIANAPNGVHLRGGPPAAASRPAVPGPASNAAPFCGPMHPQMMMMPPEMILRHQQMSIMHQQHHMYMQILYQREQQHQHQHHTYMQILHEREQQRQHQHHMYMQVLHEREQQRQHQHHMYMQILHEREQQRQHQHHMYKQMLHQREQQHQQQQQQEQRQEHMQRHSGGAIGGDTRSLRVGPAGMGVVHAAPLAGEIPIVGNSNSRDSGDKKALSQSAEELMRMKKVPRDGVPEAVERDMERSVRAAELDGEVMKAPSGRPDRAEFRTFLQQMLADKNLFECVYKYYASGDE